MGTYVTSLRKGSRLAHIGNMHATACGIILVTSFYVSDNVPPDRTLCGRCVARITAPAYAAAERLDLLSSRDRALIAALKSGADNAGICRRLHLPMRTAVRYLNDAQRRAGARTRFQWGYLIGRYESA